MEVIVEEGWVRRDGQARRRVSGLGEKIKSRTGACNSRRSRVEK